MLLHFRIQIANIVKPPVWRKLLVPDSFSFHRFHHVIQAAFGWEDCHLYQFSEKGHGSPWAISVPFEDDDWMEVKNSRKIKLKDVFNAKGQNLIYIYDFGDDWMHKITVEEITEGNPQKADCIAGKGACPPEDCGGHWGYENLKKILADPAHPEHNEMREWLALEPDEDWSPDIFNAEETRIAVREV